MWSALLSFLVALWNMLWGKHEATVKANKERQDIADASRAAGKVEGKAEEAAVHYQEELKKAEAPLPPPQSQEEWERDLEALNERHRQRVIP